MPSESPILDPFCSITNLVIGHGTDAVSRPVHVMSGAPMWLVMAGLACILLLTHVIVALRDPSKDERTYGTLDLLKIPFFKRFVLKPWFPLRHNLSF